MPRWSKPVCFCFKLICSIYNLFLFLVPGSRNLAKYFLASFLLPNWSGVSAHHVHSNLSRPQPGKEIEVSMQTDAIQSPIVVTSNGQAIRKDQGITTKVISALAISFLVAIVAMSLGGLTTFLWFNLISDYGSAIAGLVLLIALPALVLEFIWATHPRGNRIVKIIVLSVTFVAWAAIEAFALIWGGWDFGSFGLGVASGAIVLVSTFGVYTYKCGGIKPKTNN